MYCDNCKVEVVCKTNQCPLCHKKLDTTKEADQQIKTMERAFPKRPLNRPLATTPFNKIYLILSLNIGLISIISNAILTPKFYWSLLVIGALFYVYFFIRYTVLSYGHLHRKIFGQTIALIAIGVLIQQVFKSYLWIYEYVLPAIVFISITIIGIYITINIETARKYIFSMFLLAIIGLVPLFIVLFLGDYILWPSIIVALTCGSIILTIIIQARKLLWAEIKRIFHI